MLSQDLSKLSAHANDVAACIEKTSNTLTEITACYVESSKRVSAAIDAALEVLNQITKP